MAQKNERIFELYKVENCAALYKSVLRVSFSDMIGITLNKNINPPCKSYNHHHHQNLVNDINSTVFRVCSYLMSIYNLHPHKVQICYFCKIKRKKFNIFSTNFDFL